MDTMLCPWTIRTTLCPRLFSLMFHFVMFRQENEKGLQLLKGYVSRDRSLLVIEDLISTEHLRPTP